MLSVFVLSIYPLRIWKSVKSDRNKSICYATMYQNVTGTIDFIVTIIKFLTKHIFMSNKINVNSVLLGMIIGDIEATKSVHRYWYQIEVFITLLEFNTKLQTSIDFAVLNLTSIND